MHHALSEATSHLDEITQTLERALITGRPDGTDPDNFFRMGTPPVTVDIMPNVSGVEFEEAWKRRVDIRIDDDLSVPFISREDLLAAKPSAGRARDLIDVKVLRVAPLIEM